MADKKGQDYERNEVNYMKIWRDSCQKEKDLANKSKKRWGFLIHEPAEADLEKTREYENTCKIEERYFSAHTGTMKVKHPEPPVQFRTTSSSIGAGQDVEMHKTRHFHRSLPFT
ncbi:uncharacterized protein MONOS_12038 [Monocercomonoides exilis]|uniref:uncharacterized protein n=1 Tax=Monocercomonoides exilis TaxID=2049356 RepID=UPI00355A7785|nr:hypothetical protein MONOS_12038 [Monocercomonoides exilis]|eukprot:MONOS_12038.1-p1 / transcript=MONOS_12038.1 / gene=MONOS_12038 / organism=Monocercomonoides_exilis_PA203 / gene_product=unspecified product / transcript_product=unspecified product / location=Mono_scaffold00638:22559-23002(+) / protein_length=114 / sequence_SO=supercontig / SO=protein_coding / is_pseudo=false